MGHLTKWDTFGTSGIFFYHFIVMKTSLSGTLFSVPKPKMNLTKWDTLLYETSPADRFVKFQGKSGFWAEVRDNKTNEPDNEEESAKECEGEEEKEEISLNKA